jgi:hypothetical protein
MEEDVRYPSMYYFRHEWAPEKNNQPSISEMEISLPKL